MKKSKKRALLAWLILVVATVTLFAPAVFAGPADAVEYAKGQYSWFPEFCE